MRSWSVKQSCFFFNPGIHGFGIEAAQKFQTRELKNTARSRPDLLGSG